MRCEGLTRLEGAARSVLRKGAVELPALAYRLNPEIGLGLARALSFAYRGAGRFRAEAVAPSRDEIVRLLGPLDRETQRTIRDRIIRSYALNMVIARIERTWGPQALEPLVEVEGDGEARIRELLDSGRPPVVTTWHIGPRQGVWAFLSRYPIPMLKLQFAEWKRVPPGWTLAPGPRDAMHGAAVIRRIRRHMAEGGWAGFAFDMTHRSNRVHRVPLFGREVAMKTAIGAVSQVTGAPVVLISARWNDAGNRIFIKVHEPLFPESGDEAGERRLVEALTRKMEDYVRAYPWEQHHVRYRRILGFPRWDGGAPENPDSPVWP